MKTIGVLGGIGPQATMDFESRLHRVAQRRIPPRYNSSYPPLVVYYHRRPPFVLGADGMPVVPLQLDPDLRDAAARMGPMVDFLVITSNTPHLFADELERAASRPLLSMVDLAVNEVRRRQWRRVGLLTMGLPTVYTQPLDEAGIAYQTLGEEQQGRLNRVIIGVMEGVEDEPAKLVAREALAAVRGPGVDGAILGCTELPFLLTGGAPDLINPIQLLAEAAVEHSMGPGVAPDPTSRS